VTNPFQVKRIDVPGVLSDDALQEQLKQFAKNKNLDQNAAPPPDSAVDFADRIQREYLDKPTPLIRSAPAALPGPLGVLGGALSTASQAGPPPPDRQAQAIDARSNILSDAMSAVPPGVRGLLFGPTSEFMKGGIADQLGTLTPEERKAAAEQQAQDAADTQKAVQDHAALREQLRALSDQDAAAMGFPTDPGGPATEEDKQALAAQDQATVDAANKQRQEKVAILADPSKWPTQAVWLDAIQSGLRSAADMPVSAARWATEWMEMGRDFLFLGHGEKSTARAAVDTVSATLDKMLPGDKTRSRDFIHQLAAGGGSMAAFLVGGYAAQALGIGATVATAGLGAMSQGDQQFQDAEQHGARGLQKYLALIAGSGLGLTEAIPIDRMFHSAEVATGGLVSRLLQTTAAGAVPEFLQEFGQQVGSDVVAKWLYDSKREIDWNSALMQGVIGGITGGLAGAAVGALHEAGVSPGPTAEPFIKPAEKEAVVTSVIDDLQKRIDQLPGIADAEQQASAEQQLGGTADAQASTGAGAETQGSFASLQGKVDASAQASTGAAAEAQGVYANIQGKVEATTQAGAGAPAQQMVQGPGGSIPVNPNGQFELHHYGPSGIDVIDPAKRGTGALRGQERQRLGPPGSSYPNVVDRSYFGVGDPTFVDRLIEANRKLPARKKVMVQRTDPYHGEGLGPSHYVVHADPNKIYNWYEDPLNLRARLDRSTPPQEQVTHYEKLIHDAGFDGIYFSESPHGQTAVMFKPTTPTTADGMKTQFEVPDVKAVQLDPTDVQPLPGDNKGGWVQFDAPTYVAFKPTQIKSALNGGNFDPNNPDLLANTASTRNALTAEQQRPAQGVPTPASAEVVDVSLSKISRNVIKLLDLTARQGRLTLKGGAVGQYSRKQDVVRVKTWNDLETLVHEGGHAVYFDAGDRLKRFLAGNDTALKQVATDLYGGDVNTLSDAQHVAEGFAEFFRVYTLNRAYADSHYAQLAADFDAVLEAEAPQLKTGLETIGEQYRAWLQLPSQQLVRNMIVSGKQTAGLNAAMRDLRELGFGTWFHEVTRRSIDASVNRYASLSDITGQLLSIGQANAGKAIDLKQADNPYVLMRLATNAGARAQVQLTDGVMGYRSTAPSTRGLREALLRYHGLGKDANLKAIDPVRQQDFAAYLVALRGIDEYRRLDLGEIERPPVAATLGDLLQTVDELNAKYGTDFVEAALMVHEYGMGLWQKQYDAGLMDRDTYVDGKKRLFYAPLQRDMSDKKASLGSSALTSGASIVKRFRGSDRDIVDPMDVLMHKTFALEQIVAKNDVAQALGLLADKAGKAGALVERVPAQQLIGKQFSVREVARQLTKDDTVSASDAADLMTILQASIENDNVISMFRQEQASTKGENIIFYWEKGKLAALQLADGDLGADVVNVLNGLGRENLPLFTGLLSATTSVFRAGIVSWPDFLIKNFIVDQFATFVITDVGFKPFVSGIKGVFDELRQRDWARQYNAAMGSMGGMNVANLHDTRVNRDIASLRKKGYLVKAFSGRGLKGSAQGFANLMELTETGTRMGVFKAAYKRARADGLTDWEASIEAAYTSMDMRDFGLNGSRTLMFRKTIPFLNAQLQGLYKMMRVLGADEVRQRQGLGFVLKAYFKSTRNMNLSRVEKQAINTGRKAWIKMAALGLFSAALHFLFQDDPDYQEAGEYLRATNWVIPTGNGRLFVIPKPYELALLANFTERALESASGDPTAKDRFMRSLYLTLAPNIAPPLIQALVDQHYNKDSFTGREIVPSYMQALAPELQFNNYTSEMAKKIGATMGWSPMVVDHFMSSLGASAYRDVMTMVNGLDPNRPSMDATDAPILRRFIRDVRRGSASAQDFWGEASSLNGSLRSAEVSYKNLLASGNEIAANEFLNTLDEDHRAYAILATNFEADAKRLNPFYRARQLTTIVSAMRREMVSPLGLADTTTKFTGAIQMTADEKAAVDEALSEYARREMRNTLIAMGAPGWAGKRVISAQSTIDLLAAIDPRVSEELVRRIDKANVYSFDTVNTYWPEVKDRLLRDRENTFLKDILTIAKVMK